jgi:hypothetical protein
MYGGSDMVTREGKQSARKNSVARQSAKPQARHKVSPLRQRMICDMELAGYTPGTQQTYIGAVVKLQNHYKIRPDSGKIEQALEENDSDEEKLLIIDETHKYRNELTADYANLHQLCQRNKVMLLSATPFNNRPQDVFSMVKLFQILKILI